MVSKNLIYRHRQPQPSDQLYRSMQILIVYAAICLLKVYFHQIFKNKPISGYILAEFTKEFSYFSC